MLGTTHIHHCGVFTIFQLLYIAFHDRYHAMLKIPILPSSIILPIKY